MTTVCSFAERIHVDIMDGILAPTVSPDLIQIVLPQDIKVDLHLMVKSPDNYLDKVLALDPYLVILHAEADFEETAMLAQLKSSGIKTGLAVLQATPVEPLINRLSNYDYVLVFGGHLGYQGGQADLRMLDKVRLIKQQLPSIEIGWDGGINDINVKTIAEAGVSVFNVGGYIHNAINPQDAYAKIKLLLNQ